MYWEFPLFLFFTLLGEILQDRMQRGAHLGMISLSPYAVGVTHTTTQNLQVGKYNINIINFSTAVNKSTKCLFTDTSSYDGMSCAMAHTCIYEMESTQLDELMTNCNTSHWHTSPMVSYMYCAKYNIKC